MQNLNYWTYCNFSSFIFSSKFRNADEKILTEQESFETLKFFGLLNNIEEYQKNITMPEENINQEFSLNKIDEKRNYLIEEINWNESMSKKHQKTCRGLNYIEHYLSTSILFISDTVALPF